MYESSKKSGQTARQLSALAYAYHNKYLNESDVMYDELADQTVNTTGNGSFVYDVDNHKFVCKFKHFNEVVDVNKNPYYVIDN